MKVALAIATATFVYIFSQYPLPQAMALNCANGADHCWAEEYNQVTNYGNSFTTIITNLVASNCNDYFATVEQWIRLPNGDWLESGFTTGTFNGSCISNEISFHGGQVGSYFEVNDGTATIGSTKTYEVSDTNKDKTWLYKINSSTVGTKTVTYTSGTGQQVGAETTDDLVTIPKTHIWDIQMYKTTGWSFWTTGDFIQEAPPLGYQLFSFVPAYTRRKRYSW